MADVERDEEAGTAQGGSRRVLSAVAVLAVVIVAVVVAVLLLGDDDQDEPPVAMPPIAAPEGADVVSEFDGDGDGETGQFEVSEGWQIRWETEGERLELALVHAGGTDTVLRLDDGPTQGVTNPEATGSVSIEVTSDGAWRLIIVDGHEDLDQGEEPE